MPKEKLKTDLDKLMIFCNFDIKNCTQFPYSYNLKDGLFGSCLDLNIGSRNDYNSIIPGSVYAMNRALDGLYSFFYIGNAREISQNTLTNLITKGLSVRIFNQSETVLRLGNDIIASPGYCTTIRLIKTIKISMPQPYSDCQDLNSFSSDLFDRIKASNTAYRQSTCIEICLHEVMMKDCSCFFEWLPNIGTKLKACANKYEIQCGYNTFQRNIDQLNSICLDMCKIVLLAF